MIEYTYGLSCSLSVAKPLCCRVAVLAELPHRISTNTTLAWMCEARTDNEDIRYQTRSSYECTCCCMLIKLYCILSLHVPANSAEQRYAFPGRFQPAFCEATRVSW
jgi:hypothetical protein